MLKTSTYDRKDCWELLMNLAIRIVPLKKSLVCSR
jgi:hypothetical protein